MLAAPRPAVVTTHRSAAAWAAVSVGAACAAGCAANHAAVAAAPPADRFRDAYHATVQQLVGQWRAPSQELARQLLVKYGQPDEATPMRLVWHNKAPWKRMELVNFAIPHRFPAPHEDLLTQVIDYAVPADRADELLVYNGSLLIDRTRGELASRADSEAVNFLAINLANEILRGARTPEEARLVHAQAVQQAQHPQYKYGLLFPTARVTQADPDQPLVPSPVTPLSVGRPQLPPPVPAGSQVGSAPSTTAPSDRQL